MIPSTSPRQKVRKGFLSWQVNIGTYIKAIVSGVAVGQGQAPTRKEAKQIAAIEAIRVLQASG